MIKSFCHANCTHLRGVLARQCVTLFQLCMAYFRHKQPCPERSLATVHAVHCLFYVSGFPETLDHCYHISHLRSCIADLSTFQYLELKLHTGRYKIDRLYIIRVEDIDLNNTEINAGGGRQELLHSSQGCFWLID